MSGFQITMIGRMGAYQRKYHFTDSVLRGMWGQGNFHHNFSQGFIKCFSFKFDIYMGEHPILCKLYNHTWAYPRQSCMDGVIFSTQDLDGKKSQKGIIYSEKFLK